MGNKMKQENLLSVDGYVNFIIEVTKPDVSHIMSFKVYEVISWECDEEKTPYDKELYVHGDIKWEGCSHIWFGEDDSEGYLHLCGRSVWERHCGVMSEVFEYASRTITNWDSSVSA